MFLKLHLFFQQPRRVFLNTMRRIEKLNSDEFFNIYVKSKSNLLKLENSNESVMILFREGIKVEINGIFHSRGGKHYN